MSKAVAKRKLKKSYYEKNTNIKNIDLSEFEIENDEINGLYRRNGAKEFHKSKEKKQSLNFFERKKQEFKFVIMVQSITSVAIVAFICAIKFLNIDIVKQAEFTKRVINEFNSNLPKEKMLEDVSIGFNNFISFVNPIIPEKISNNVVEFVENIFGEKTDIIASSNQVNIYNEEVNIYKEEIGEVIEVNTNNIKDVQELVPVYSSISNQDEYIELIKASGIEFVKPTTGIITSHFGAREEIFDGVESYHYGTDIANVIGTPVYSSMEGVVTVCSYNNETGNYIEVQNGNIITRYCHLSEQLVNKDDKVQKGDLIGKIGNTGYVTGAHLHFEIMYNRNRVDASKILELN